MLDIDLSNFSQECAYCFESIATREIFYCSCRLSVCSLHIAEHVNSFLCHCIFMAFIQDNRICTNILHDSYQIDFDLNERINEILKNQSQYGVTCPHIKQTSISIPLKLTCDDCSINEGVYTCITCFYTGCGRKQYGAIGNGHMLNHCQEFSKHTHAFKVLNSRKMIYCYLCDSFIRNLPHIEIVDNNHSVSSSSQISNMQSSSSFPSSDSSNSKEFFIDTFKRSVVVDTNFKGILNTGNICYLISSLELIARIFSVVDKEDISSHFMNCKENALECFVCQFIKVVNGLNNPQVPGPLDIHHFLDIFFECFEFRRGEENDVSELFVLMFDLFDRKKCPFLCDPFKYSVRVGDRMHETGEILFLSYSPKISESFNAYFSEFSDLKYKIFFRDFLIIGIKRYVFDRKLGYAIKIRNPIVADDIINPSTGDVYRVDSHIAHEGYNMISGHYVFYDYHSNIVVNDDYIGKSSSSDKSSGYFFLYRKVI